MPEMLRQSRASFKNHTIMEQELKITQSFAAKPSVLKEAKENAWRERTTLSQKIEELLVKYNKSVKSAKKEVA